MEIWPVEHRMFVYDAFVKSGESVSVIQRLFRWHFNVGRHGAVPSHNMILLWVNNFQALTHKPRTLNDLKEAVRHEISSDRSSVVGPCHGRFKKKGLKTASKKTVVILPISFLKLNHLVWHVLSFNFV